MVHKVCLCCLTECFLFWAPKTIFKHNQYLQNFWVALWIFMNFCYLYSLNDPFLEIKTFLLEIMIGLFANTFYFSTIWLIILICLMISSPQTTWFLIIFDVVHNIQCISMFFILSSLSSEAFLTVYSIPIFFFVGIMIYLPHKGGMFFIVFWIVSNFLYYFEFPKRLFYCFCELFFWFFQVPELVYGFTMILYLWICVTYCEFIKQTENRRLLPLRDVSFNQKVQIYLNFFIFIVICGFVYITQMILMSWFEYVPSILSVVGQLTYSFPIAQSLSFPKYDFSNQQSKTRHLNLFCVLFDLYFFNFLLSLA